MPKGYVLCVVACVLGATPAAAGILTDPSLPADARTETTVTPVLGDVRPVRAASEPGPGGPDPLRRDAGHAMWDPTGGGCVDGGDPDAPFPSGKGALRAEPFCLPQPCDRALDRVELARSVVGRPVTDAEWDGYVARYATACRQEAVWPQDVPVPAWATASDGLSGGDILRSSALDRTRVAASDRPLAGALTHGRPHPGDEYGSGGTLPVDFAPPPTETPPEAPMPPSPVPLPPVALLMGSALGALGLAGARPFRRRAAPTRDARPAARSAA